MKTLFSAQNSIVLKPKRDAHVRNKHPWVFMGAISSSPEDYENGKIITVLDSNEKFLGYGYFYLGQSISGRMVAFIEHENPEGIIIENLAKAIEFRSGLPLPGTNGYRLVNGEADFLPGLIVDKYDQVLVLQFNTLGMDQRKSVIVEYLQDKLKPKAIYEKSASPTRRKEGLSDFEGWIYGQDAEPVIIEEHSLKFSVQFSGMQKTGFFLDQREMRALVKSYALNKTLLNCFAYTGGFSIYALAGGAKRVDSIDISENATQGTKTNLELNGYSSEKNQCITGDVLEYFRHQRAADKQSEYDFIILDPPAFAKRSSDIKNASRGYREINRAAMEALPSGGLLLTSSCSAHIDKNLFQTIIFQAAKDAKKNVKILSYHVLAADHPVSLFYPEGDYLKSLLLVIE